MNTFTSEGYSRTLNLNKWHVSLNFYLTYHSVFPDPSLPPVMVVEGPLRTEFPVFWKFLGIPRNSQKFPIMQMTFANWIPSFLRIPRNSQEFPTMQINSDFKSLVLLGISGKGRPQFCEDLESPGIPRNSQLYKLPII